MSAHSNNYQKKKWGPGRSDSTSRVSVTNQNKPNPSDAHPTLFIVNNNFVVLGTGGLIVCCGVDEKVCLCVLLSQGVW